MTARAVRESLKAIGDEDAAVAESLLRKLDELVVRVLFSSVLLLPRVPEEHYRTLPKIPNKQR